MATVAIAIPNLNGAEYLRQTLQSIQLQTIRPDEVLISDNHSNDNSLEIIKEFPDLKINVVQPQLSLTMSQNWNYAASKTKSDWFFLLSNDDLLRDTAVSKLKFLVEKISEDVAVISFKSEIINEESVLVLGKYRIGPSRIRKPIEFLRENIRYLHINAAAVAIRKSSWEIIGGFPESYNYLHDLVFYQRMILKFKILDSKEVLGRYRIYKFKSNSESRKRQTELDFLFYESNDLKEYIEIYPDLQYVYYSSRVKTFALIIMKIRQIILFYTTFFRRFQDRLGTSGFPNRK